jgi:hypothetical protein
MIIFLTIRKKCAYPQYGRRYETTPNRVPRLGRPHDAPRHSWSAAELTLSVHEEPGGDDDPAAANNHPGVHPKK